MNGLTHDKQRGLSFTGLIFILAIGCGVVLLGMKVVPTVTEYRTVSNAIVVAKKSGDTVAAIRDSFDKQADAGYIESIAGKDLDIEAIDNNMEIAFAYQKKIPLFGPVSLVIDYSGSTSSKLTAKNAPAP